jgi:hypothetical protein
MARLEARKDVLEAQLAQGEDVKVAVHPNMAGAYRDRIANLRIALAHVERVCSQTVRSAEVTSEMLTSSLAPLQEIAGRASERTHRPVA